MNKKTDKKHSTGHDLNTAELRNLLIVPRDELSGQISLAATDRLIKCKNFADFSRICVCH